MPSSVLLEIFWGGLWAVNEERCRYRPSAHPIGNWTWISSSGPPGPLGERLVGRKTLRQPFINSRLDSPSKGNSKKFWPGPVPCFFVIQVAGSILLGWPDFIEIGDALGVAGSQFGHPGTRMLGSFASPLKLRDADRS